jgi:hypothetical protein
MPAFYINLLPSESSPNFKRELLTALGDVLKKLESILNRGITFSDNVDCKLVSFTSSGTPDAENTVAHGIGKVPTGYIVYSQDKAASLYKGSTAWTATNIYLKCNVATVIVKIVVF